MTQVASFSIQHHQVLNPGAQLVADLPVFAKSKDNLIHLYRQMQIIRQFDKKVINLQRTGKMGTFPSTEGQEAVFVGAGDALSEQDVYLPYYRDHAALIQHGVQLREILAYWGGHESGSHFENALDDFPIAVPIATQYLHATGVAFAIKYRNEPRVVMTSIGEGGTSKGDFYEALNAAGVWQLPVVFIVNNNQWAISVPQSIQSGVTCFAQKAIAAGIEGVQVDGNDIIAMRMVTQEAVNKARRGGGPTLIEAKTFRLCDHTTADDATRYQPKDDVLKAQAEEPLIRIQAYLRDVHEWSDSDQQTLLQECSALIDREVDAYLSMSKENPNSIFDHLYETLPTALQWQREHINNQP